MAVVEKVIGTLSRYETKKLLTEFSEGYCACGTNNCKRHKELNTTTIILLKKRLDYLNGLLRVRDVRQER